MTLKTALVAAGALILSAGSAPAYGYYGSYLSAPHWRHYGYAGDWRRHHRRHWRSVVYYVPYRPVHRWQRHHYWRAPYAYSPSWARYTPYFGGYEPVRPYYGGGGYGGYGGYAHPYYGSEGYGGYGHTYYGGGGGYGGYGHTYYGGGGYGGYARPSAGWQGGGRPGGNWGGEGGRRHGEDSQQGGEGHWDHGRHGGRGPQWHGHGHGGDDD